MSKALLKVIDHNLKVFLAKFEEQESCKMTFYYGTVIHLCRAARAYHCFHCFSERYQGYFLRATFQLFYVEN